MALETLKGVTHIDGESILSERTKNPDGSVNWEATDEARKFCPIFVDHDVNMISFRIQDGPIKEVGKNGCQVTALIDAARIIIEKLNEKYPCRENYLTLTKLDEALLWQLKRTKDREARQVEGESKA
jgi:hypothetical protein